MRPRQFFSVFWYFKTDILLPGVGSSIFSPSSSNLSPFLLILRKAPSTLSYSYCTFPRVEIRFPSPSSVQDQKESEWGETTARLHDWQPNRRRQIPWREFNPAGLFVSSAAKWIPFKLKPEDTFSSWPDFTPRTSHIIIIISVVAAFLHFQFSYQKEIPQVFAHPVQPPWNERTPRCPERRVFTSPHLYVMLLFRATEDTASQSTKEQKSLSAFRIHSELIPGAKWFSWMCLDQVWILLKTLTVTHSLTKNTRK